MSGNMLLEVTRVHKLRNGKEDVILRQPDTEHYFLFEAVEPGTLQVADGVEVPADWHLDERLSKRMKIIEFSG